MNVSLFWLSDAHGDEARNVFILFLLTEAQINGRNVSLTLCANVYRLYKVTLRNKLKQYSKRLWPYRFSSGHR